MHVPLSWLAEFVSWDDPVERLLERLTMSGLKVEGVETVGDLHPRIVVGRLLGCAPHPQQASLTVCELDVGAPDRVTIVAGGTLFPVGRHVAVGLPGARLASGRVVAPLELHGVRSGGLLCSMLDCAFGPDREEVVVLPDGYAPGTAVRDLPGVRDTVVEFEVTSNRGDCLSVLGVAREVAAVTGARLREPRLRLVEAGPPATERVSVRVEATDLCPCYTARVVRGVRVGRSPLLTRLRLERAGMRALNDVVDATNYVLLERGQPLHAFDLGRLAGGTIVVRRANAGERLVTLDGVERVLLPDDLVIADADGPVALAGIMGGRTTEVTDTTVDLLVESAVFAPQAVRRTSRRLGLFSQASYRFERGVDPAGVRRALDAVAVAIRRTAGGRVAPGLAEWASAGSDHRPAVVRMRPRRVLDLLGMSLPRREMVRRLRAVGARVVTAGSDLLVEPPSWRQDLTIEADLAEEIARLGGYDAVPSTMPVVVTAGGREEDRRRTLRRLRWLLAAEGLSEVVTLAFADGAMNQLLPGFVGSGLRPVALANPLSEELGELRRSPLIGLVRMARFNVARGATFVGAFELGKGYGFGGAGEPREPRAVAVLLWGQWPPRGLERHGPGIDFYDLKGVLENALVGLGHDGEGIRWRPAPEVGFLHPGKAARLERDTRPLGVAGALHPKIAQVCDLPGEVWVAELDFEELASYRRSTSSRPIPRFPAVHRDIAVVVDEAFEAGAILEEIRNVQEPLVESARVFDCYRGAPVPAGRKSLAFSIAYRATDRTLTDDEVNAVHARLRERLRERFSLELRS